ncbi:MAG: rhomboid family intramembrane serine protease [Sandaracinaceae bacterium]
MRSADLSSLFDVHVPVTFVMIGICVAVSVVGFWALRQERYRPWFVFVPSRLAKGEGWVGALLSHFAHGDVGHLFLNMLALYFFGPSVEEALGPLPFAAVYLASGLFGTFAIWLFRRKSPRYSALGASGAVAGVVFASVIVAPTSRIFLLLFPSRCPPRSSRCSTWSSRP